MSSKILFDKNENNPMKGNEISFSSLEEGMKISFQNEKEEFITGEVVTLYVYEEDKTIGCKVMSSDDTPYALYEEDGAKIYSSLNSTTTNSILAANQEIKSALRNNSGFQKGEEIQFASIKEQMEVVFMDEQGNFLIGTISQIYTDKENNDAIIGCEVETNNDESFDLSLEDGDKIYYSIKAPVNNPVNLNQMKKEVIVEPEVKKVLVERPNIFQGRTDAELENAKFPDWDIIPPNQFINPRIKPS